VAPAVFVETKQRPAVARVGTTAQMSVCGEFAVVQTRPAARAFYAVCVATVVGVCQQEWRAQITPCAITTGGVRILKYAQEAKRQSE